MAVAGMLLFGGDKGGPLGEDGENWKYHEGLKKGQVTKVDRSGPAVTTAVTVGAADLAPNEAQIRSLLTQGNTSAAKDLLLGGAVGPDGKPQPELDEKLVEKIKSGAVRLYNVNLWDSVDVDGDIAEVLVDNKPFRRVGLTKAEQTVTIPLPAGQPAQISIRGVADGGGGITLGCRTSGGTHFLEVMRPGESIILPIGF